MTAKDPNQMTKLELVQAYMDLDDQWANGIQRLMKSALIVALACRGLQICSKADGTGQVFPPDLDEEIDYILSLQPEVSTAQLDNLQAILSEHMIGDLK